MADIQKLIKSILADTKVANSNNFNSKVYRDEPILKTAVQLANFTPPKYREMRRIAKGGGIYNETDPKIFYEQGKFMEDFEDDFDYRGEFIRYFPTYQSMNDAQLRGYFSWRTRVRRGIVEKTLPPFVFVYIYELLNQIGVSSIEEGFYALKNFWSTYKEIDAQINGYVQLWLNDYVVYNNLDKSLLDSNVCDIEFKHIVITLLNYKSHDEDEVFSALNSLSSYNLGNSKFFKQHPVDVKIVVYNVYAALSDYYDKNRKNNICERFIGRVYANPYTMFKSAVFYQRKRQKDFVYKVDEINTYRCRDGNWNNERFYFYGDKNRQIGTLLKTVDFLMRQKYNFKSTLKAGKTTKVVRDIISKEIEKYQERKKKMILSEVEIDVSKLQNIRKAALKTQKKLIVEEIEDVKELMEADVPESSGEKAELENDMPLGDTEYQFMQRLLYSKGYDDLLQAKGAMLSVIIDTVNENLFEMFNDTVIIYNEDKPEIIEDYIDELKGIIKE